MGVLSKIFRRSSSTSTEDASAATQTAESPDAAETAEEKPEETAEAKAEETADEPAEGVDIPKQQSADAAADSEAGDGARK